MKKEWIKTDDLQFVAKSGCKNEFEVIDIVQSPEGFFIVNHLLVNLDKYDNKEIETVLKSFGYEGIEDVISTYGTSANQIVAECIAESDNASTKILDTLKEVSEWLKTINQNLEIVL